MAFSGLPPSTNWYCSSTCDANKTGVLAYASRNSIVLLNICEDGQSLIGFLHGHEQRVAAVAFNKLEDEWLATCSDDCLVNVWNWRSKSLHKGHKYHESKVTSLSWHPSKKDVLTTGDEKGKVISWNQTEDVFDCWSPEREPIACLAYSNGADQWLAIGYKRGLILILDTSKKEHAAVVFRLRGHDDDVHSMCWSPSTTLTGLAPSDFGDADGSHGLSGSYLLSGGEDQHVRIWLPHEEKMVHSFKLPPKGGSKSKGHGDNRSARGRLWVTVWWPDGKPEQFLSSSFGGDILFWDLNKIGKQKWTVLDSTESHNRPVYSLLPIRENFFLTSSMDRQLILWNLETLNACWSTPTLGGFIYQLTVAPKDTATIAMGVGDNMIRVWNTNARGASCKSTTLWQGLRSKVTVICWHPEKEGVLAFGSEDGRVGIFTSINPSKSPNLSRTFHKKTVYSLSFGPHCCKPDETSDDARSYCLFSSGGEGVVYQHHDDYSLHQEAVSIDAIIRRTNSLEHMFPLRSEVSWRSDRKVVALGNDDGSIEIFAAPHLSQLCTITVHHKIINCLQWFPCQPFQGQNSPLQYCLASGSNESVVCVHDLAQVLGQKDRNRPEVITTALSFPGHLLRITSLQWNPLADGKLASVSYDGTAQIWDVSRGEALANFRGHHGRLLSVAWSHLDPDEIFTGGEDFCVMRWRISECSHKQPPKDKKEFSVKFYNSGSSNKEGKKKKKKNKESCVFSKGSDTSAPINGCESPTVVGEETASETSGYTGAKESKVSPMVIPETNDKQLMSITELLEKKRRELTVGEKVNGASMGEDGNVHVNENSGIEPFEEGAKIGEDGEHKMKNGEETENLEDVEKTGSKAKRKKGKSYFPVCSQQDNRGKQWYLKDCMDIAERNYGHTATDVLSEDLTHLGLFTSKKDLSQTMTVEGRHHQDHGNLDFRLSLDVWQGKFLTVLREAIHKGQLSDKMVAMAPQAGHDVWLETCSGYAKQLEQNRDPQKAATYYICCHQIHNAVRVLKENKHFREAASVATARLSRQDAARIEVYRAWAAHLEEDHKFEAAARCYLAIDEPVNAANLLARGGSQAGLRAALGVAISADKKEILFSLVSRYANECMLNGDWSEVWKIPSSDVTILCLHLVMIIHETIVITLLRSDDASSILDAFNDSNNSHHLADVSAVQGLDHFSGWPILTLGGTKPLLSAAVSIWEAENHPYNVASKGDILEALQKLFVPTYHSRILKQFLISAAVCVALDWMEDAAGINQLYSRMENILQECLRVGDVNLMKALLSLVYPNGFFADMLREPSPEVAVDEDHATGPTEACYAYAVLYHLWWDRAVRIDQETSVQEMQNTSAEGATKASTQIESPLSDESDGINSQGNVPSPLASSEIEANGCLSATGREDTQNALPSEKKQSDVTPVPSCGYDSQGSLREIELHPSSADGQDEVNITSAWNRFVLKRTKICKKVLVRTNAVLWYRLRKELEHIKDARRSKEAESDGDTAQGTDESFMEKECNSLINKEECVGSSSANITLAEVLSGTASGSTQSEHLPMFKKYLVPSVTMATLTEEESRLEQELANLDSRAEPPDPIESLLVIASLSSQIHLSGFRETEGEYTAQALVAYGIENSCTESQERHFMKLKTKLDKVDQP